MNIRRGSIVTRRGNPRHKGRVAALLWRNLASGAGRAVVVWSPGWKETVPVAELQLAPNDEPARTEVDVLYHHMENYR